MAKPNEVEAFQSFCRRYINLEVKKYFNDVKGDDESLYTSSTARFVIRNICLHKDKDPLILSVGRMLVFYLIVNIEKEPQYEAERPRTDKIRSFKPIVTLYFVQSKLDVKEGFRPVDGRISFRLMNESSETLTKRKLETLARQIKKLFASSNGYIWKKGKFQYTYADWEKGYQLQILARTEAQAKEIVTQVLKIQSHVPEWKNFFISRNNKPNEAYPGTPETLTILGKKEKLARRRPVEEVKFVEASIKITGLANKIVLYNRQNTNRNAILIDN